MVESMVKGVAENDSLKVESLGWHVRESESHMTFPNRIHGTCWPTIS